MSLVMIRQRATASGFMQMAQSRLKNGCLPHVWVDGSELGDESREDYWAIASASGQTHPGVVNTIARRLQAPLDRRLTTSASLRCWHPSRRSRARTSGSQTLRVSSRYFRRYPWCYRGFARCRIPIHFCYCCCICREASRSAVGR
jgi:hypothetical protein